MVRAPFKGSLQTTELSDGPAPRGDEFPVTRGV